MILKKIILKNFRQFYGEQELTISCDPEKNVTLIHAENGVGKTTILNAILWCFYKETTARFEQPEKIANYQAVSEDSFQVKVEVLFEHEGNDYIVSRELDERTGEESFKAFMVSRGNFTPLDAPNTFVDSVVPKEMARYFFFDGEYAETFSSQNNKAKVKEALENMLGCRIAIQAIKDLNSLQTEHEKQIAALTKNNQASGMQTKRVSTGTTNWESAEQFRAQFIAGLNNPAPPEEPTIGYLLERYWDERGQHTRSPKTIERAFKKLMPFFGKLLPSHVSNQLFRKFAEEHQGTSHGSIIRWLGILKAALRYAEGSRWIAPLPPFKMPVNHPPPRDLWLTREQVAKLIENAKSPHIDLFIKLAIFTGARSGAILDLTWDQVNMDQRIINFGRGWGNKRRAIVPMNDEVHAALLKSCELAQSDHVIEFNGKPLKSIKKAFERLSKACDIKASPHVLRHTAATWLVMDGVPLREVARLLGNSEAMVEKVYGKHAPDYLRRAVNALSFKQKAPEELKL